MTAIADTEAAGQAGLLTSADIIADAGITYRQCDFWVRRGFLHPGRIWRGRSGTGHGSPRVWPPAEAAVARTMAALVKLGLSLEMAHGIARSGESRTRIAPGIWLELGPALSGPCDRDDHGACFPDEPSGCGCECHGEQP